MNTLPFLHSHEPQRLRIQRLKGLSIWSML